MNLKRQQNRTNAIPSEVFRMSDWYLFYREVASSFKCHPPLLGQSKETTTKENKWAIANRRSRQKSEGTVRFTRIAYCVLAGYTWCDTAAVEERAQKVHFIDTKFEDMLAGSKRHH